MADHLKFTVGFFVLTEETFIVTIGSFGKEFDELTIKTNRAKNFCHNKCCNRQYFCHETISEFKIAGTEGLPDQIKYYTAAFLLLIS